MSDVGTSSPPRGVFGALRSLNARRGLGALRGLGVKTLTMGGRLALDLALPLQCVACHEPVSGDGLCAACWRGLSFIAPPYCPRLGIPFAYDPGEEVLSAQAQATPPAFGRARAAVRYDDVAKTLVHALKFHDRTDLAPAMGRWMARAGHELLRDADIIVPVPLHWRRGFGRRYNQAGLLARVIANSSINGASSSERVPQFSPQALQRIISTQQQIGLSRAARAQNVQNAFSVPAEHHATIAGRRVLLIDDVLTTGATSEACARALTRSGAASVDVLVFARVVDSHTDPI